MDGDTECIREQLFSILRPVLKHVQLSSETHTIRQSTEGTLSRGRTL